MLRADLFLNLSCALMLLMGSNEVYRDARDAQLAAGGDKDKPRTQMEILFVNRDTVMLSEHNGKPIPTAGLSTLTPAPPTEVILVLPLQAAAIDSLHMLGELQRMWPRCQFAMALAATPDHPRSPNR